MTNRKRVLFEDLLSSSQEDAKPNKVLNIPKVKNENNSGIAYSSTQRYSSSTTKYSSIHGSETQLPMDSDRHYINKLETIVGGKNAEMDKLLHLIKFLELGIKKREEVARVYFEENTRLKEDLKIRDKQIEVLKKKFERLQEATGFVITEGSYKISHRRSQSQLMKLSRENSAEKKESLFSTDEVIDDFKFTERTERSPSIVSLRRSSATIQSEPKVLQRSASKVRERTIIDVRSKPTITMKAVTVTGSQGRKDFESLFLGGSGRISVLDMDDEDIQSIVNDVRLAEFEDVCSDPDYFKEAISKLKDQKLGDVVDIMKSLSKDFKNLLKIVRSLKKLIQANSSISVSLVLSDALERIVFETCNILKCDRASVFIVDEANQELWTKIAKGSNTTIRIPIHSGIAGYVVKTGRPLRVDEAYLDPRFNKEVDLKNNYRTKTILAVPIKDFTHRVIGVCQAINKESGIFSPDDEAVCQLLANQAGVMLKNSLQFDQTFINHQKLIRLLKIGVDMYEASKLSTLLYKAENGLKEIMLADKANAYLVDPSGQVFYNFDGRGEKITHPIDMGITGLVISKGEIMDIYNPYNDPCFNSRVDLETQLPILCLPILSTKEDKKVIAVLQVLDLKVAGRGGGKQDLIESETIHLFQLQVAACIENFTKRSALKFQKAKTQAMLNFMHRKGTKEVEPDASIKEEEYSNPDSNN